MKFKYIIVTEEYDVLGTNDVAEALEASSWYQVYDVEAGKSVNVEEPTEEIKPWTSPEEPDDLGAGERHE